LMDLMDAVGHGFSAVQLLWDYNGVEQYIKGAEHKPQSAFRLRSNCPPPATRTDLRLIDDTSTGFSQGAELWPFGWAVHIHRTRSGFLGCAGLYRTLAWPYIFKHFSTRDFAEFLEVYGLPMKIGTYPNGSTNTQKREYLRSLLQLGHNAAGIFPEGMMIDFKEAVGGQPDGFLKMMEYMDKAISKAILGQTLTAGGDNGGSYALGMVHREVQIDLLKSDVKQLQSTITRDIIYPLLAVNGYITNMAECPSFEFVVPESEDLKGLTDAIPKLANAGVKIPTRWVYKKFNIPVPEAGEEVLEKSATGFGAGGFGKPAALSAAQQLTGKPLQTALRAQAAPVDAATELANAMQAQSADAMGVMMAQIQDVVANASSLLDLQDKLLRLYGDMDATALSDVMAIGFASANLRGRFEVKTETAQ
jgi:phage gp29-like protein